jgi:hypothetical protein
MIQFFLRKQFLALVLLCFQTAYSQTKDTIIDAGKFKLHFNIIEGKGIPILFEAGSGNDGTVWKDIIRPIADITGTTIITYDRAGLGKSEIKPNNSSIIDNGIINNVNALEIGLHKLGYDNELIIVAHSLGGFYATLFASRNEEMVKRVVFIDAAIPSFYTKEFMTNLNKMLPESFLSQLKEQKIGLYYEIKNIDNTLEIMRETNFPSTIPLIDLVASQPYNPLKSEDDENRWIKSHKDFTNANSNRQSLIINNASHYAFKDNPNMVINSIVKTYTNTLGELVDKDILLRLLDFNIKNSNQIKD